MLERDKGKLSVEKIDRMLISDNVHTFQWYFMRPVCFGGILRNARSFDATQLIFPKFNCKKMLVKKAKSTRTSDFSMFLYMLILNFCFLQSLKSFLGEDKLKVSLCGVFTFFH